MDINGFSEMIDKLCMLIEVLFALADTVIRTLIISVHFIVCKTYLIFLREEKIKRVEPVRRLL